MFIRDEFGTLTGEFQPRSTCEFLSAIAAVVGIAVGAKTLLSGGGGGGGGSAPTQRALSEDEKAFQANQVVLSDQQIKAGEFSLKNMQRQQKSLKFVDDLLEGNIAVSLQNQIKAANRTGTQAASNAAQFFPPKKNNTMGVLLVVVGVGYLLIRNK